MKISGDIGNKKVVGMEILGEIGDKKVVEIKILGDIAQTSPNCMLGL